MKMILQRGKVVAIAAFIFVFGTSSTAYSCHKKSGQKSNAQSSRGKKQKQQKKSQPQISHQTKTERISIDGYSGELDSKKGVIKIYAGDIVAPEELAKKALLEYSTYNECQVHWDFIALGETARGVFVYRRTDKGVERVK